MVSWVFIGVWNYICILNSIPDQVIYYCLKLHTGEVSVYNIIFSLVFAWQARTGLIHSTSSMSCIWESKHEILIVAVSTHQMGKFFSKSLFMENKNITKCNTECNKIKEHKYNPHKIKSYGLYKIPYLYICFWITRK